MKQQEEGKYFTPLCFLKKKIIFFFFGSEKKNLFFFLCNFSLPNTFLFYVCVCVDVCETKRILLFYLCFLVPTRIPFRRNPQSSSLKKRLTTLSGVCMCYAACQICVIRNLMLLARKEGKRKKKHFFIVCMCACMCAVLYVFPNFYFTKIDRVNLSSPLHFSFFCFELRNLKKQRVIIEMRFSFSQISCLVS